MDAKIIEEFDENFQDVVETINDSIIILDNELRLVYANRSFYNFFEVSILNSEGHYIYELGNKQWDIPELKELLKRILPEDKIINNYQVEHHFQVIGHKIMSLNAKQIFTKNKNSKLILLVISDITSRILAERQKENIFIELRKAFDEIKTLRGILPICASCKKIRDDKGYWKQVEEYVSDHTDAEFSHGLCPSCATKLYPDIYDTSNDHD